MSHFYSWRCNTHKHLTILLSVVLKFCWPNINMYLTRASPSLKKSGPLAPPNQKVDWGLDWVIRACWHTGCPRECAQRVSQSLSRSQYAYALCIHRAKPNRKDPPPTTQEEIAELTSIQECTGNLSSQPFTALLPARPDQACHT